MLARLLTRVSRRHIARRDTPLGQRHVLTRPKNTINTVTSRFNASVSSAQAGLGDERFIPPADRPRIDQVKLKHAAATPIHNETAVDVMIDGGAHGFPAVLLRDLCSCPLCIDKSTRQKLFVTADIPLNIQATNCVSGPENVYISWNVDVTGYDIAHKTEIPLEKLRNIIRYGNPVRPSSAIGHLPPKVYWSCEMYSSTSRDIEYESYMHDDNVLLAALRQIHTHGLLYIKLVPEDEISVEAIAERIGPVKTTFYGRTWDVRSVPEAKNVAYTAQNLGFHMDLLYMEQPPHIQLLHCIRSSSAGGASLFADSFRAVKNLYDHQPEEFRTLSEVKAAYHYDHPGSQYYHQFRSVVEQEPQYHNHFAAHTLDQINPMDSVSSVAWSPPFQAPFALNGDVLANAGKAAFGKLPRNEVLGQDVKRWHKAAQTFNNYIHQPDSIYERLMKPGECVIFDNRRVLHARRAFHVGDAGKERWLRGAYIDKDPYMSKLRILNQQN